MTHDLMAAVAAHRAQLEKYRDAATSLNAWRELQLQILETTKRLQRTSDAPVCVGLWNLLGEHFWIERDHTRLAASVEDVLAAMETCAVSIHQSQSPSWSRERA